MSIQTELTRIINAKAAIKTAIEGKGVTVPDATLLDGMAALIESIEAGGGGSPAITKTVAELKLYDVIQFGMYDGNKLYWYVIDTNYNGQTIFCLIQYQEAHPYFYLYFDADENNSNIDAYAQYGNPKWRLSNLRQFLNSAKEANNWFEPMHEYDKSPTYSNQAGFLNQFTEDELSVIEVFQSKCVEWDYPHYSIATVEDKIWIPSEKLSGGNAGTAEGDRSMNGINEKKLFSPFRNTTRTETSTVAGSSLLSKADGGVFRPHERLMWNICMCLNRNAIVSILPT